MSCTDTEYTKISTKYDKFPELRFAKILKMAEYFKIGFFHNMIKAYFGVI
jgi:hypothetical protein